MAAFVKNMQSDKNIGRKATYKESYKPIGDNDDYLNELDDGTQPVVQDEEPLERSELPYLKDPATKVSMWTMFKDNIGKDLTKIQVPVYFNDPTSQLQKCAQ